MGKIIFITKDACCKEYLPIYGNTHFSTPNINKLAKNGCVFNHFYTCAASTAMSFYAMVTGQLPYETARKNYGEELPFNGTILFDKLKKIGYEPYLAWDNSFTSDIHSHIRVMENKMHLLELDIKAEHERVNNGVLQNLFVNLEKEKQTYSQIDKLFKDFSKKDNFFLWLHLPHVLGGRNAYGWDIDIYDKIIGMAIDYFGMNTIFISSDHGNMNGARGLYRYGFEIDEPVINIPLITPNIGNLSRFKDSFISNEKIFEILTGQISQENEYIISDTAYYCQRMRSTAIIHNGYKLVYIKEKNEFKLYDVNFDSEEKYNLFNLIYYDSPRRSWQTIQNKFYYSKWKELEIEKDILLRKFNDIYRNEGKLEKITNKFKNFILQRQAKRKQKHPPKSFNIGSY